MQRLLQFWLRSYGVHKYHCPLQIRPTSLFLLFFNLFFLGYNLVFFYHVQSSFVHPFFIGRFRLSWLYPTVSHNLCYHLFIFCSSRLLISRGASVRCSSFILFRCCHDGFFAQEFLSYKHQGIHLLSSCM